MDTIRQKEEAALAEARQRAATLIASRQRGKIARRTIKEEHLAATKVQALVRGKAARRGKFVLAEAQHAVNSPELEAEIKAARALAVQALATSKPLSLQQLGLRTGLPRNPVPTLRFLTFDSWWTEMGTKRYMEPCFDLETELFQARGRIVALLPPNRPSPFTPHPPPFTPHPSPLTLRPSPLTPPPSPLTPHPCPNLL